MNRTFGQFAPPDSLRHPDSASAPPAAEPSWPPAPEKPTVAAAPSPLAQAAPAPLRQIAQAPPALPPARMEPEPAAAPPVDVPWWLREAPARTTALAQPGKTRAPRAQMGSWNTDAAGAVAREPSAAAAPKPAPEESSSATPSRLSGLRALFFSHEPKEAKEAKHPAAEASEAAASPAPQPVRPVPVQAAKVAAPRERTAPVRTFVPIPEPEPAFAAAGETGMRRDTTGHVTETPEFLLPKPLAPPRRDRREACDDVQILPSWRGQYKRKD